MWRGHIVACLYTPLITICWGCISATSSMWTWLCPLAPFVSYTIAEMVEYQIPVWDLLHYMDDFITAGPPESPQCKQNLGSALEFCQWLGLALLPCKCVGPFTIFIVLDIAIDSLKGPASPRRSCKICQFLASSNVVQQGFCSPRLKPNYWTIECGHSHAIK